MPTREWTFEDEERTRLREFNGPWLNEPDKIQWVSETGLDCLMVRNRLGAWCGYVGVTEDHPWFEKDYQNLDVDVHGSLTFADFCQPGKEEARGVCHVPFPGRSDRIWWLGFDCAHIQDLMPVEAMLDVPGTDAVYRDQITLRVRLSLWLNRRRPRRRHETEQGEGGN